MLLASCSFHEALSNDFVEDAVRVIVTRFLPLSPKDLDAWMADPEEWVDTEEHGNEQWEYELRVGLHHSR